MIGNRIEKTAEVEYVFQDLHDLPEGFTCPQKRTKPWGTGQAILAAKDVLSEPFIVINADDYYGKEAYVKIHDYLVEEHQDTGKLDICMAGFILENTLSDNGSVTRGICPWMIIKIWWGLLRPIILKRQQKALQWRMRTKVCVCWTPKIWYP